MSEQYISKIKNFGCRLNSQNILEPGRVAQLQGGSLHSFIIVPLKVAVRVCGGIKSFQIDGTPINQNSSVWKKENGVITHGSSWQETAPIARNVHISNGVFHKSIVSSMDESERYSLSVGGWTYQGRGGQYGGYGTPQTEGPDTPAILGVDFSYSKFVSSGSGGVPSSSVSFQSYSTLQGLGANHSMYFELFGIKYELGGWLTSSAGAPTPPSWVVKPLEFFEMADEQGNPLYNKTTGNLLKP